MGIFIVTTINLKTTTFENKNARKNY